MYLLDTMVVSETVKRRPHAAVTRWLASVELEDCGVSVMTMGELERGLAAAERHDPLFATRLSVWIQEVERDFAGRIMTVELEIARTWGRLVACIGNKQPDLLLAATALVHDLTVVTRNIRHFDRTGVTLLNPYEAGA